MSEIKVKGVLSSAIVDILGEETPFNGRKKLTVLLENGQQTTVSVGSDSERALRLRVRRYKEGHPKG